MSALAAVVGPGADEAGLRWATEQTGAHGAAPRVWRPAPAVVLAAAGTGDEPGAPSVAVAGDRMAVADAALYYRAELVGLLRGAGLRLPAPAAPAATLILAAYAAWGDALAERLEGDFAFLLWDGARRRLVAARDFVGRRGLYHAGSAGTSIIASRASAVAAHPRCPATPDLRAIAVVAAGLPEIACATPWAAVRALPAGHTLVAELGRDDRAGGSSLHRHWTPPTFERSGGAPFADAAAELRATLRRATAERLDVAHPTAVWLSGGWDSPTVYGAAHEALRTGGEAGSRAVRAVSMSYPPGDPGREDELIESVVAHWSDRVAAWRDSDGVALFGDDAGRRDLPFAHPYAEWSRSLGAATREAGARVALDGGGGDQLFQVSPIYLADLLARLRLASVRREWRARSMTGLGWRRFVQYAVLPLAPGWLSSALAVARGGRPVPAARHWTLPAWIRTDAPELAELEAHGRTTVARRPGERHAAMESRWYFESAYPPAALLAQAQAVAEHGVELRSPLLDGRVIALASYRPREERSDRGETKRLLRAAAAGLVPDALLAPRAARTGMTSGFFRRTLQQELPQRAGCVIDESALADLGIVDPAEFGRATADVARGRSGPHDVALFYTVQSELWLRARAEATVPQGSGAGRTPSGA